MPNNKYPMPGTLDAIERGCTCEVVYEDPADDKNPIYILNPKCPVHRAMAKECKTMHEEVQDRRYVAIRSHLRQIERHFMYMTILWVGVAFLFLLYIGDKTP